TSCPAPRRRKESRSGPSRRSWGDTSRRRSTGSPARSSGTTRARGSVRRRCGFLRSTAGIKPPGPAPPTSLGAPPSEAGVAHFPSLDASFRSTTSSGVMGELFADTWSFAMELRLHAGWRWGPGAIILGMGGRLIEPPDRGLNSDLHFGILWTFDFDVGIE